MTTKAAGIGAWISAFRLRTLPLALASILLGSFLAAYSDLFRLPVLVLSILTTILLQVLSNLANDYGDSVHGADGAHREGPSRAVQSGIITPKSMKRAMTLFVVLSFLSGVALLLVSFGLDVKMLVIFLSIGILSIVAAVFYTSGKNPYGYMGFGDLSVMIFFGFVGVLGTYYLHTGAFNVNNLLLAATSGFFATAVLNINNIRDIESDRQAGKKSIPVRIGRSNAVIYHWILLGAGWSCAIVYTLLQYQSPIQLLFFISFPLFVVNGWNVARQRDSQALDPYLKQMALSTLLFVVLIGIGLIAR